MGNGDFSFPGVPNRPVPPNDYRLGLPPELAPPEESPEQELDWFEREGEFELPKFKYEEVYETILEKFKERLPLDFVESFKNASSGSFDLIIKIDFLIPAPFNFRVGPKQINVSNYITEFAQSNFGNIIRLVLLVFVCLYFIVSILGVIFT
jgi:hypothetical protein